MVNKLTTESLGAIRKRAEAAKNGPFTQYFEKQLAKHAREDILALLAEIDRLQSAHYDMTSIALWSARRLPKIHKDFAYNTIDEYTGDEVERL